jgi:hypothetical protein
MTSRFPLIWVGAVRGVLIGEATLLAFAAHGTWGAPALDAGVVR